MSNTPSDAEIEALVKRHGAQTDLRTTQHRASLRNF